MHATIVYASLAPFHVARVAQAARAGLPRGDRVSVIEVAGRQRAYSWHRLDIVADAFRVVQLFPDLELTDVPRRRMARRLYETLDSLRPDVVFLPGWGSMTAWLMLAWARSRSIPRVLVSESQREDRTQYVVRTIAKRLFLRHVQAAFVGGTPHRRYLATLGFDQRRTVPGCAVVDNTLFEDVPRAGEPDPGLALISSLRLIPEKNIIATLDHLRGLSVPWRWAIAGEGPLRHAIACRIREQGMEERVRLLGQIRYADMPGFYATGQVYLQPSMSEPWGLAVNEAMASGLPVVVSRRCGCREDLVGEGNGLLYDPEDETDLRLCVERMWATRDHWAEMGRKSRGIVSQWGLERFAEGFWTSATMARCES